jgi:lysozyme
MRTLLAAVAILAVLAGAAWVFLSSETILFGEPSPERFPVRGIDVSHHQGEIDWTAVAGAEVSFSFIKATEGADHHDPRFDENWRGAGAARLGRGAYHYFTFCTAGTAQAEHFLQVLPSDAPALPATVDVEFSGNCSNAPADGQVRAELADFLERVEAATGRKAILYVTRKAYRRIVSGRFNDNPIWLRNTFWEPSLGNRTAWMFWQYTDRGQVPGIKGTVDLNVFNGTTAEFRRLLESGDAKGE